VQATAVTYPLRAHARTRVGPRNPTPSTQWKTLPCYGRVHGEAPAAMGGALAWSIGCDQADARPAGAQIEGPHLYRVVAAVPGRDDKYDFQCCRPLRHHFRRDGLGQ